jgi:hypothetical protein
MPLPDERRVLRVLLAGRCFELHDQFSGYSASVLHLDALSLGPLADLGSVQPPLRSSAPDAGGPAGSAADPPPGPDIRGQGVPQLLGVLGVQVDLI